MISRVSQALSQFVKPIASSTVEASASASHSFQRAAFPKEERPKKENQGDHSNPNPNPNPNPNHQPPPNEQLATVIELPNRKAEGPSSPDSKISIPHAFVLFFREFQQRRHDIVRWLGKSVYNAANQTRPRGYRKGAMLDHRAE